jgi:hypothetical protein
MRSVMKRQVINRPDEVSRGTLEPGAAAVAIMLQCAAHAARGDEPVDVSWIAG